MVNKHSGVSLRQFRTFSEDICSAWIQKGKIGFILIVVHIPSNGKKSDTFAQITNIVSKIPPDDEYIIIGDFNGHLGADDIKEDFKSLIGKQLAHRACNENGFFLLQLVTQFELSVRNTFARSKSVLQTWTNQRSSSQIDHILQPKASSIKIKEKHIKAEWPELFSSDHKILSTIVRAPSYYKPNRPIVPLKLQPNKWDVKLLTSETYKKSYSECVNRRLQAEGVNASNNWNDLKTVLTDAANEAIPLDRKIPRSPRTQRAYAKLQKMRFRRWKFPDVDHFGKEVNIARRDYEQTKKESIWRSWNKFFTNINEIEPHMRVRKTYEFLKQHKRFASRKGSRHNISQHEWLESLLESIVENQNLQLLPEDSVVPPPSLLEIRNIVYNLRNGTSPGLDNINVELLRHAPKDFFVELEKLIRRIWMDNKAPEDITETIQIPIPKIAVPKKVTDFRKITLCNVIYKVIAVHTLNKLDESIDTIPTYQAAFLSNRAVEDHIFTAKRITEEFWNKGTEVYVLALDIKQAFDSVSQPMLIEALKYLNVPNYIINRIINLGLYEKTCIKWLNQQTPMIRKSKGVKQGCPLSPRLFTIVLHYVLCRLKEQFPEIHLEQQTKLKTPLILAYADDLLIICEDLDKLNRITEALKQLLAEAGLEIHPGK